jgi:regulator of chromosome condensation
LMGFGGVDKMIQYDPVDLPWQTSRAESDRFIAIAAGTDHVLALSADGYVFALGDGEKAQLGRKIMARRRLNSLHPERLGLRKIVSIGAGAFHSFAINEDGQVYGWGNNLFGQLGVAASDINPSWEEGVVERPTIIKALNPENHGGARVKLISAGENHSLFLFDNGALFSCGKIVNNELGIGADHPAMTEDAKEAQKIVEPVQVSLSV